MKEEELRIVLGKHWRWIIGHFCNFFCCQERWKGRK